MNTTDLIQLIAQLKVKLEGQVELEKVGKSVGSNSNHFARSNCKGRGLAFVIFTLDEHQSWSITKNKIHVKYIIRVPIVVVRFDYIRIRSARFDPWNCHSNNFNFRHKLTKSIQLCVEYIFRLFLVIREILIYLMHFYYSKTSRIVCYKLHIKNIT